MFEWLFGKKSPADGPTASSVDLASMPAYVQEFEAAVERTERLGLGASPVRLVVRKDCVDMAKTMPVLLDYFGRHDPPELVGQTAAIHFALVPLLVRETGIPFQLTIGWMVHDGRTIFQHDEETYRRFLRDKFAAWSREGMPFHLWLTSPAYEILDVTFAMNLGWAKTREQCETLVIYQPAHTAPGKDVYHPMVIGADFFNQSGATIRATGSGV
jgi:hypothetical protein